MEKENLREENGGTLVGPKVALKLRELFLRNLLS
jgi:hypothetical protein